MWREFFEQHHSETHRVFMSGDVSAAAQILSNPKDNKIFWGFDDLVDHYHQLVTKDRSGLRDGANLCQDYFIRLAEAIGAFSIQNPESRNWRPTTSVSTTEVFEAVETLLGIDVSEPDVYAGRVGVQTPRGVMSYRSFQSIYLAHRLNTLLQSDLTQKPDVAPRVCEIGAGLGRSALYARRFGLTDYTIVDIPFTSISQGYYLMRALGEDAVVLPGEGEGRPDQIKLRHPDHFFGDSPDFDLIVNQDSITELGEELATEYLVRISELTSYLVSFNHEVNEVRLFELLSAVGRPTQVLRFPYWMRPGYVEELVRFG